jgi:hypothetical protein
MKKSSMKEQSKDVGLPKDKDGFYIDGGKAINGGGEFKDFAKGLDFYNPLDSWGIKYLGTALNNNTCSKGYCCTV